MICYYPIIIIMHLQMSLLYGISIAAGFPLLNCLFDGISCWMILQGCDILSTATNNKEPMKNEPANGRYRILIIDIITRLNLPI